MKLLLLVELPSKGRHMVPKISPPRLFRQNSLAGMCYEMLTMSARPDEDYETRYLALTLAGVPGYNIRLVKEKDFRENWHIVEDENIPPAYRQKYLVTP
jgi:hypothetical protein